MPWQRAGPFPVFGEHHLEVRGCIGISYLPAYRLWRLLGAPVDSDVAFDIGTLQDPPVDMMTLTIRESEEVDRAADVLVSPIFGRGIRRLRQYASVDAMLSHYHDNPNFEVDMRAVPTVLAAAGRYDQARSALTDFLSTEREEVETSDYLQFSDRLAPRVRWVSPWYRLAALQAGVIRGGMSSIHVNAPALYGGVRVIRGGL
jgi:hypothetical protein